jgi:hypothetical protein
MAVTGESIGQHASNAIYETRQDDTEALAKAIASGAIIDNGKGYQVKDKVKLAKLGIEEEELGKCYAEVGKSTKELRDFGKQLLETEK